MLSRTLLESPKNCLTIYSYVSGPLVVLCLDLTNLFSLSVCQFALQLIFFTFFLFFKGSELFFIRSAFLEHSCHL